MGWAERIDSIVSVFNPMAGYRRSRIRKILARSASAEDRSFSGWSAADSEETKGARWVTSRLSYDDDLKIDLENLRPRAREAVRNDPYAASYVESIVTNTVGKPFRVQSRMTAVEGDPTLTEPNIKKWNLELEELWKRQCERIGLNGESLHEIKQLAMRHWATDGEILIVFSDVVDDGRPLPIAVQVVDPARLETPPDKHADPRIVMGVERDAKGRIVAYHFRKGVVGDGLRDSQTYERIPANRVCHIFDKWHADQTRGFPKLAPSLDRLKDIRDLHDAAIMHDQVASCFGVVIKSANPYGTADSRTSATLTDRNGNAVEELKPGAVTYTNSNSEVSVLNPQRGGSAVGEFTNTILHAVSAGANIPCEIIGKDYTRTTYSSGRLSLIDGRLNFEMMQKALIRGFLKPLWSIFVRQAVAFGEVSIDQRDFNKRSWLYDRGEWRPTGWPWIDPVKEIEATKAEIDAGLITYADALAERGYDLDETLEQRWKEKQKLKEYDLLPPDPQPTAPGKPQPANQSALESRIADVERRLDDAGVAA